MAIAHDTSTRFPSTDTTGFSTTSGETLSGNIAGSANATGVVAVVFHAANSNPVSTISYGGTAMTLRRNQGESTEAGAVYIYDLLGDVGGTKSFSLTRTATTTQMWVVVTTFTTAVGTISEFVDSDVGTSTSGANPTTATLSTATDTFIVGGVHGGAAAPTSYAAGSGYTVQFSADYGAKSARASRSTTVIAAGTPVYNFTYATADDYAIVGAAYKETTPTWAATQEAYRFYEDGTEAGSTELGTQSTALSRNVTSNSNILLRVRLKETAGAAGAATDDYKLQYKVNSGSWTDTGTGAVTNFASSNLTDSGATTERLTGGTGTTFAAGEISEDGTVDDFNLGTFDRTEFLYSLTLNSASLSNGDAITFQVLKNGATTGMTYSATPTLNITKASFALTQADWAFYEDGTETASTIIGSEATTVNRNVTSDSNILLRVRMQETGGAAGASTDDYKLQYRVNGGTWTDTGSGAVTNFNSSNFAEADATTNRLSGGTGSFVAGKIAEDGTIDNLEITASNFTELLYALTLNTASITHLDSIEFRVLLNNATTNVTYTATPTLIGYKDRTGTDSTVVSSSETAESYGIVGGQTTNDQADQARNFLLGTDGVAIGILDEGFDTGGYTLGNATVTYSNDYAFSDTLSMLITSSTGGVARRYDMVNGVATQVGVRAYIYRPVGDPDPVTSCTMFYLQDSAGVNQAMVRWIAGGSTIQMRDDATGVGTALTFPKGEWVRVEWYTDAAATTQYLRLFYGSKLYSSNIDDYSVATSGALDSDFSVERVYYGMSVAPDTATPMNIYYDAIGYREGNWVGPSITLGINDSTEISSTELSSLSIDKSTTDSTEISSTETSRKGKTPGNESFEAGSNGAQITTTDTEISYFQTPTDWVYSTDWSISGTKSAKVSTTGSPQTVAKIYIPDTEVVYRRVYTKIQELPGATASIIMRVLYDDSNKAQIRINSSGQFELRNLATLISTSTTAISAGDPVRLEWMYNSSTGNNTLRIFVGANIHGTTPDETLTSSALETGVPINEIDIGYGISFNSASTRYFDDVAWNTTDWIGPSSTTTEKNGTDATEISSSETSTFVKYISTDDTTEICGPATLYDNFNRASLGANWNYDTGLAAPIITANEYDSQHGSDAATWFTIPTDSYDHWAQITVRSTATPQGFMLRGNNSQPWSSVQGYKVTLNTTTQVSVQRVNSGSNISVGSTAIPAFSIGDVFRAEVEGRTIRIYINGSLVATETDTVDWTPGKYIGFYTSTSSALLDNFSAGDLAGTRVDTSALYKQIPTSDSTQITSSETSVRDKFISASDSTLVSSSETSIRDKFISASDSTLVSSSETSVRDKFISASDTTEITSTDAKSDLTVYLTRADSTEITSSETSIRDKFVSATDSTLISSTDAKSDLTVYLSRTDSTEISSTDSGSLDQVPVSGSDSTEIGGGGQVFSDDFNRADNTTLGANWIESSPAPSIVSNQVGSGGVGQSSAWWATQSITDNNYCQINYAVTASLSENKIFARGNGGFTTGQTTYAAQLQSGGPYIQKIVNGSLTNLTGDLGSVGTGTTIFSVNGSTLTFETWSVTDTSITTGKYVGFQISANTTPRYDDFVGGDIGGAGALVESSSLFVSLTSSDSTEISSTEASTFIKYISATDSTEISSSDAGSLDITYKSSSDSTDISSSEIRTIDVYLTRTDATEISSTEASTFVKQITATDSTQITSSETSVFETVQRSAADTTNLIAYEKQFNDDTVVTVYNYGSGVITKTLETTEVHEGAKSLKVVTDGSIQYQGVQNFVVGVGDGKVDVVPGSTYLASAWIKGEAGQWMTLTVHEFNSSKNYVTEGGTTISATGSWQQVTMKRTVGAGTYYVGTAIRTDSLGVARTFYIDEWTLVAVDTPTLAVSITSDDTTQICGGGVTFSDDFNRADSTGLGANWTAISGSQNVVSNQAVSGTAPGVVKYTGAASLTDNNYAQITMVTRNGGDSVGVICRMPSGTSHYGYLWRSGTTSRQLFKIVNQTYTALGSSVNLAAADGSVLRIEASGSTITGYDDTVNTQQVTDTSVTTGTYCGMRSAYTGTAPVIDDFSGGDLSGGTIESAQIYATFTSNDPTEISSSETTSFGTSAFSASDSTQITSTESATPSVSELGLDSTLVGSSETADVQISGSIDTSGSDSTEIGSSETRSVAVSLTRSDSTEITSSETKTFGTVSRSASDTTQITSSETSSFGTVSRSAADSTLISSSETSSLYVTIARSDTTEISSSETSAFGVVSRSASDTTQISSTEAASNYATATGADTTQITSIETSSPLVSLTRTDSTDISSTDSGGFDYVPISGSDSTLIGAGGAGGQSFSDDFNRADSGSLGANWIEDATGFSIVSNEAKSDGTTSVAFYATQTDTDDNWSEVTTGAANANPNAAFCRGDGDTASPTAYGVAVHSTLPLINKWIAGTRTALTSDWGSVVVGDTLRIEADGTTISAYHNGVLAATITDNSITTGKYVGFRAAAITQTYTTWSGGDFVAPDGVFSDDFVRADAATLGPNWVSGHSIVSNQMYADVANVNTWYNERATTADNFTQVTPISIDNGDNRLYCRGNGTPTSVTAYYLMLRGNGPTIFKAITGTVTELSSDPGSFVSGDVMYIEANGSSITSKQNGSVLQNITDTSVTTGRYSGIRSASIGRTYEDFSGGNLGGIPADGGAIETSQIYVFITTNDTTNITSTESVSFGQINFSSSDTTEIGSAESIDLGGNATKTSDDPTQISSSETASVSATATSSDTTQISSTETAAIYRQASGSDSTLIGAGGIVFSDDFNRADGPLGANWIVGTNISIVSNKVLVSSGSDRMTWYAQVCNSDDNYAEFKANLIQWNAAFCRGNGATVGSQSGYMATRTTTANTYSMYKVVSAANTQIGSATITDADGSIIHIEANGSTIIGMYNGSQIASVTDTSVTTGKYCGVWTTTTDVTWDDFAGGDLAGSPIEASQIYVSSTQNDTTEIGSSETASNYATVSASDSTQIGSTESYDLGGSATKTSSDTTEIGSSESVSFATVQFTRTDSTQITSSETAAPLVSFTKADSTEISSSETSNIDLSGSIDKSASDTTQITTTESGVNYVSITRSDTTEITSSESRQFATVTVSSADTTQITSVEAFLFATVAIAGTDATQISSSETSAFASTDQTDDDTTQIGSSETVSIYAVTVGADSTQITATESGTTTYRQISVSDTTQITATESVSFAPVTLAATDATQIGSTETAYVGLDKSASDSTEIGSTESGSILLSGQVTITGSDSTEIGSSESVSIGYYIIGSDSTEIVSTESYAATKQIAASDSTEISVVEAGTFGTAEFQGYDDTDIGSSETSVRIIQIFVYDSTEISSTETRSAYQVTVGQLRVESNTGPGPHGVATTTHSNHNIEAEGSTSKGISAW